ncbi:MAG: hypothetical protein HY680_01950 [Chloroflexi bacterium]|nr:hypothetical protein [Chloroflexota bacterium]
MEARIAREVLILFGLAVLTAVLSPLAGVEPFSPVPVVVFRFLVAIRVFILAMRVTLQSRRKQQTPGPCAAP